MTAFGDPPLPSDKPAMSDPTEPRPPEFDWLNERADLRLHGDGCGYPDECTCAPTEPRPAASPGEVERPALGWCNHCAAPAEHDTASHPDAERFAAVRKAVDAHWFHGSACIGCGFDARLDRNRATAHIATEVMRAVAASLLGSGDDDQRGEGLGRFGDNLLAPTDAERARRYRETVAAHPSAQESAEMVLIAQRDAAVEALAGVRALRGELDEHGRRWVRFDDLRDTLNGDPPGTASRRRWDATHEGYPADTTEDRPAQ